MIALAECPLVGFPTSAILSFSGWPWYQFQLSFTIHLGFEHNYAVRGRNPWFSLDFQKSFLAWHKGLHDPPICTWSLQWSLGEAGAPQPILIDAEILKSVCDWECLVQSNQVCLLCTLGLDHCCHLTLMLPLCYCYRSLVDTLCFTTAGIANLTKVEIAQFGTGLMLLPNISITTPYCCHLSATALGDAFCITFSLLKVSLSTWK